MVIAAVVLSITIAPLLIRYNKVIGKWLFRHDCFTDQGDVLRKKLEAYPLSEHTAELKDHVIICGFGRVGQVLARFL